MRILLVEDSPSLQRSLSTGLHNSGYAVDQAFDGEEAHQYITGCQYDVIILDIMIPKINGLALLEQLRRRGDTTSVLILSARDTTEDRIKGLDIGADDYLVKPFSFEELLSRLRALMRRAQVGNQTLDSTLNIKGVTINTIERSVAIDNSLIPLTPYEYKILEHLARRQGQVINHDQLIDRLYSTEQDVTRNVIEVHVSSLRRKLRSAGSDELINTRRGFGYYIAS
jgi:DNA-binding response OmpR family regulator